MSIDEAKAAKVALRERLQAALNEFTKDTGLTVDRLDPNPCSIMGADGCRYLVDVEVRL